MLKREKLSFNDVLIKMSGLILQEHRQEKYIYIIFILYIYYILSYIFLFVLKQ